MYVCVFIRLTNRYINDDGDYEEVKKTKCIESHWKFLFPRTFNYSCICMTINFIWPRVLGMKLARNFSFKNDNYYLNSMAYHLFKWCGLLTMHKSIVYEVRSCLVTNCSREITRHFHFVQLYFPIYNGVVICWLWKIVYQTCVLW